MNILSSADLSRKAVVEIYKLAGSKGALPKGSTVALFFEEPSTRTRVSFEVATAQLGGTPIYIDAHTSQAMRGEALADTAKVLSLYCNFIAVRMNSHEQLLTIAKNSKVPVINALTSLEHPTQALADCYTILNRKGPLDKLKIAFIGDIAQNTANSLLLTATTLGADVSLVGPDGCNPKASYISQARRHGKVSITNSIKEGLDGADVVYTDTFVSMGDEAEAAKRRKMFAPYQLNKRALDHAKKDAIVMHPLPAHRGEEVTANVIDGKHSVVWEQAGNKLPIEKAVLLYLSKHK